MSKESILVTGAAGFIGFHLSSNLLKLGYFVTGLDNLNNYYDVELKRHRLSQLKKSNSFSFEEIDLCEKERLDQLFASNRFSVVINLAAQAGVRYSIDHPYSYLDSNLTGFLNVLESCRNFLPDHLIFASSSSVYGANKKLPFSTHDNTDHPLALYAASKKANELMAHAYAHLYHLPVTGLRFFTVYGPYGRPDMALFMFTRAILTGQPIDVYNFGRMKRDFTYVDDIVSGIVNLIPMPPSPKGDWNAFSPDPSTSSDPYQIFNIGNHKSVELGYFIEVLENSLGKKAIKNFLPLQDGDVEETYADIDDLNVLTGFKPTTAIEIGIPKFVGWYKEYYKI